MANCLKLSYKIVAQIDQRLLSKASKTENEMFASIFLILIIFRLIALNLPKIKENVGGNF